MYELDMNQANLVLGENVRKYRILRGLKQEELAKGLCSISQLSKFETGKAQLKPEILKQFADRLGVTLELLETSDALLVELRERMQVASQAGAAGHYQRSLEITRQVMEKADSMEYPDLWVEGLLMECRLLNAMQEPLQVIETIERTFRNKRVIPGVAKINLLVDLARAYETIGKMKAAYDCYNEADEVFAQMEQQTDEENLRLYFRMGSIHYQLRNNLTGLRFAERAVRLATEKTKHAWRIRSMDLLANLQSRLGRQEQAKETFMAALQEAQDNNMLLETGMLNNELGYLLMQMGDLALARVHLQRARHVLEIINEEEELLGNRLNMAELSLREGDTAGCKNLAMQTHALLKEIGEHTYLHHARVHDLLGQLSASDGDVQAYTMQLLMALDLYDRNEVIFEAYDVAVRLADAFYEAQDPRAVEYYRKAIGYKRLAEGYSKK